MATANETITAALRESNLIALGQSPTTAQQAESLSILNGILAATPGFGAGEELGDINFGGEFDQSGWITDCIPPNARLVMASAGARALKLHPQPYDGQRLAMVDATGDLSVNPLTLLGNGRRIEGQASLNLDTDGETRQWFYRADLGQWVRLTGLEGDDDLPFPIEFDQYFSVLLAMRLNPRYGQEMQTGSSVWLETQSTQLEARYRRPRDPIDWPSPALLGRDGRYEGYASSSAFTRGRPWP